MLVFRGIYMWVRECFYLYVLVVEGLDSVVLLEGFWGFKKFMLFESFVVKVEVWFYGKVLSLVKYSK